MRCLKVLAASAFLVCALFDICLAATKLPPRPTELFVTDYKGFTPDDHTRFIEMLGKFKKKTGVTLYFVIWSEPLNVALPEGGFARLLAQRWHMEDKSKTIILARGGIYVTCFSSKDLEGGLDYMAVEYLQAKFISPLKRPQKIPYSKFKRMVVDRMPRALNEIELFLQKKNTNGYLFWKIFEASPSSSAFGEYEYYLIIVVRYLLGLLCLIPTLIFYLFIITKLADRQVVSADYFPLIELAVMGVLITLQVVLGFYIDYGSLRPMFMYVGFGGVLFMFTAPLHLILFRQQMSDEQGWPKWVFILLYIIFPIAVFVAGSALAGKTRIRYRPGTSRPRTDVPSPSIKEEELEKSDSD